MARALERLDGCFDERVIDTHRPDFDPEVGDAERVGDVVAQRMPGFGAKTSHVPRCVIARQRRQIDQRDGAQQPRGLPFFLYRPARRQGCGPALDSAPIYPDRAHDVEIERHSRISLDVSDRKRTRRRDEGQVGFCGHLAT
jgi:hypothetical protein